MNSKQFKKKNTKTPEKMKIKTENLDNKIYTMEHYVGDPVELIKQVFSSLNTKTIKNLAPECLKQSKIEEIQELCFNELLGISSKRLKSIINATKCPTDTESSDDDIENIDEHISLEEISSDSDNGKILENKLDKTKNGTVNLEVKTKGANNKEMSVLELLELQARARAIRSQLALEPIAKIEVDSDDSNNDLTTTRSVNIVEQANHNDNSQNRSAVQSVTLPAQIGEKRKHENNVIPNGTGSNLTTIENRPKKIKLKRNFRKRSIDQNTENDIKNMKLTNITDNKEQSSCEQQNTETLNGKSTKIDKERSPSPEVLTIIPNYETLCISDSDEDGTKENNTTKSIEKPIENDDNDIEKSSKFSNNNNNINISTETNIEDKEEDFEDGEIIDNKGKDLIGEEGDHGSETNYKSVDNKKDGHKSIIEAEIKSSENNSLSNKTIETKKEIDLNDYDHHNDDIISLGDDDLDYEMRDPVDNVQEQSKIIPKIERKSPEKNDELNESADFIELHDSGDENEPNENQGQSWNTRWLQSKKVSKIMAESKLGNRVRDKRKKVKKAQQAQQEQQQKQQILESTIEKVDPKSTSKANFSSIFEDGSVQQYKQIVDLEKNSE